MYCYNTRIRERLMHTRRRIFYFDRRGRRNIESTSACLFLSASSAEWRPVNRHASPVSGFRRHDGDDIMSRNSFRAAATGICLVEADGQRRSNACMRSREIILIFDTACHLQASYFVEIGISHSLLTTPAVLQSCYQAVAK